MNELFKSISKLKGVGEKRSLAYKKLGVSSPYDLLYHLPRRYLDYTSPITIADAAFGETAVLRLTVTSKLPPQHIRKGFSLYKATATDGVDDITIIFYNNNYIFDTLIRGNEYCMSGKISGSMVRKEILSPHIIPANSSCLIRPVYHLTTGLTINRIAADVQSALDIFKNEPFEWMPEYILSEHNLMRLPEALPEIHFPSSMENALAARRRLAFDELLELQLGLSMYKKKSSSDCACKMDENTDISCFFESLPFAMTNSQREAVNDICKDLAKAVPMNRLLQGDVGSGKTAVAAAACYFAVKNNTQCALMAPTEILAVQHYHTLSSLLSPLGVNVGLLTGSVKSKERKAVIASAASGETGLLVGTHAIFQKDVEFQRLALVITDEQHRFGVAQRSMLAEKGGTPHKLVMSATPIPRTLALIIYGDLDISVLRELPGGRKPIETYAVTGKLRERSYNFIKQQLSSGRQGYIVCPMIEENSQELQAAAAYAENISKNAFADYRVGLLHGKLSAKEKDTVMESFQKHEIDLLVCTTVVEVGINVPNAAVMLIENSDRFGLSQLHQLRGRVGRGEYQSYCILMTDRVTDESRQRLRLMSSTSDGFKIAEEDLKMRGPGDFFGERQHGLPPLKIADLTKDMQLFEETKLLSHEILKRDPELMLPENRPLRLEVLRLFARAGENGMN
ncbi:MAG: ATP-dependent DNA helicase RecG [Ruminococcus sp.]|nr:ATP-dependent DNA helicase RecG [Ruminococcus sp.]